ncbi:LAETG motif-containing sortase-dependent surface protein [Streptomyces sp. NPDC003036]|uniref:LAETG motif-containing sortase-dependent surface protein n=1 Tax=Streptomyces sp. NPDC003036 TaxID=3154442 RepID=UPI0033B5C928
MKLRRAMAVAAATAVIAPAAFLAAPAAYATDGTTSTTSTGGAGEQGTTTPDTTTPDTTNQDTTTSGSTTPDNAGTTEGEKPAAEGEKPAAEGEKPAAEGEKPAAEEKPATGEKPADKPAAEGEKPATGDKPAKEEEGEGEGDEEFACEEGSVSVSLGGFPNKITAGSGWKNFTFNVKNTGKQDIRDLNVFTAATYADEMESEEANKLVDKYAHFEYKDPESGEWINDFEGSGVNNGVFFGQFDLDAGKQVTIDLRVKIDKGAPAGDGLAIAVGAYDNGAEDESYKCFENGDMYPFQVLAAGKTPGEVEDAKPSGEKPKTDVKPQGEAKPLPVTGNLAETGSSSMLPVIGIAGGITIVAGAGVVFAMRRRNSGATA